MSKCILATGGAGYIGSHVVVELLNAGYRVVILDNFEKSEPEVIDRIEAITGKAVSLVAGDVRDRETVERVLRTHNIDAVIHLAGKKAVGESVADPLLYYGDNLNGALSLLAAMRAAGVTRLAFSSSATVYGTLQKLPINETAATGATSPYGRTKLIIEEMIDDCSVAWPDFSAISLRYFNPVGAHRSGMIGENPRGTPNNLFPYVVQTAAGEMPFVRVFGDDYLTVDGTGLRDYIHVVDLAQGHVAAIAALFDPKPNMQRHQRLNLGTGKGYTVLQVIAAFARACGRRIPHKVVARREGDIAASVADPSLAQELLSWQATMGIDRMCMDQWIYKTQCMTGLETFDGFGRAAAKVTGVNGTGRQPSLPADFRRH
jgi:UDP-glucose 4-epimerase